MSKGRSGLFKGTKGFYAVAGDLVFRSPVYGYFDNVSRRKDIDPNGMFDVIAHGDINKIQIEMQGKIFDLNSREVGRILKHNSKYKNKQPIRLLSCNTGTSITGFAQNLSNKLNAIVYAPNNLVWAYPNGKIVVAPRLKSNPNFPDLSNQGKFITFYPGGKKK